MKRKPPAPAVRQSVENQTPIEEMRRSWDERVTLDYRYWMADGHNSDEQLWECGRRDFAALFSEMPAAEARAATALEFGSGVGRLLLPASEFFGRVVGVDVSLVALERSRRLLPPRNNILHLLGDGRLLSQLADDCIDVVYSFAVLGHLAVDVLLDVLRELTRVLRAGGSAHLQIYLGDQYLPAAEDTLDIRSYERDRFLVVLERLGLNVQSVGELQMPFDATDKSTGRFPFLVRAVKSANPPAAASDLRPLLISGSEPRSGPDWPGSRFEYLLAVTRVNQLVAAKQFDQARKVLEFAISRYRDAEPEAHAVLAELKKGF